ncbi:MAG: phosphatidylserine decarboxylase [Actinomycetota bacterium]|nr:phosphatidylserine decarboxylase [Actinomycetota bacterium]
MPKSIEQWIDEDVTPLRDRSIRWLSEFYFFRDPPRPTYSDNSCFFSPADGIILYHELVAPDECIVDIKGKSYSLRQAMRDGSFDSRSLVIGIFMTFFDVHLNRVPFSGRLSYKELDPIDTYNHPMLEVERAILDELRVSTDGAAYLHNNQRMLNRVCSTQLAHTYYVLQVADYDVDCILPFELKQNRPTFQGQRFSTIRYGSQVDLIIPLSERFDFTPIQQVGMHVEAGIDPLVGISARER